MADDSTITPYIRRLFQIESGGNPNAVTGSNRGLGQFGPREEARYGITAANRTDPMVQAAAVAAEQAKNTAGLTKALGRDPTASDHYLAHQQGLAGATSILSNPTTPAWQSIRPYYNSDAMAQKAITGNIPSDSPLKKLDVNDVSGSGFAQMWANKFNQGMPDQSGAAAPPLPAPTDVAPPPGGVPAAPTGLADLGSTDNKGGGSLAALGKMLMTQAAKPPTGLPFPVQQFDASSTAPLRKLPLNLPNFG